MTPHQQKIELQAQLRTIMGGKVSALRKSGFIPAVLYGKDQDPISLQIPQKDFHKTFKAAGESTLVYVNVDGQAYPTIIHDIARDPQTDSVMHADFYKVRLDQKIKAKVPVAFTGVAPAVKDLAGIFVRNVNELEVEALPQNLPHEVAIDISGLLKFGDHILLKDVKAGTGIVIHGHPDEIIAIVQEPISEEALKASLETTVSVDDVKMVEKEKKEEVVDDETPVAGPVPDDKKPEKK